MPRAVLVLLILVLTLGVAAFVQNHGARTAAARIQVLEKELADQQAVADQLRSQLNEITLNRDQLQKDVSEIHRLRGEVSSLRTSNKALEQELARAKATLAATAAAENSRPAQATNPSSSPAPANYTDLGRSVAALRAKALANGGATLTPEERQYLESLKPQLEKLERSPADFAAFQAEMIRATTGISDAEKTEKIRQLIQRVYENAVGRQLDLPSRPQDDFTWVEERFHLDQRATGAVKGFLNDQERAAFESNFTGVMGVDLGLGPAKAR